MTATTRTRHRPDIFMPPECREMARGGTLVVMSHSGDKDNQAMTILLSRIVSRKQFLVVHAPLGEVEWPGAIEQIEATIPRGVPLILTPVASGKTLLESIEERGRFPDAARRYCTAGWKHGPIAPVPQGASALRRAHRQRHGILRVSATGFFRSPSGTGPIPGGWSTLPSWPGGSG